MHVSFEVPNFVVTLAGVVVVIILWELLKLLLRIMPKWHVGKGLLRALSAFTLVRKPFGVVEKAIERLYTHRPVRRITYVVLLIALVILLVLLFRHFTGI